MTATAIEPSVLEALDFDITCQVVNGIFNMGHKVEEHPACNRPATHSASIHQADNCAIIEKYICSECIPRFLNDGCLQCPETRRISNIVPLPKAS